MGEDNKSGQSGIGRQIMRRCDKSHVYRDLAAVLPRRKTNGYRFGMAPVMLWRGAGIAFWSPKKGIVERLPLAEFMEIVDA